MNKFTDYLILTKDALNKMKEKEGLKRLSGEGGVTSVYVVYGDVLPNG